jgi:signal transduction histidine kinase
MEECLDNTLTIATNHIKENNVTVERQYGGTPKIECIPSKLNQLFLNIVTNASQAIGTGGGSLTIKTEHVGENIVIDFTDTGEGMDEETQHKMFDPFFTSKPIGQGTGLGMSIAYKIVEAHKGSISVNSELGKGTTMTVTLPIEAEES